MISNLFALIYQSSFVFLGSRVGYPCKRSCEPDFISDARANGDLGYLCGCDGTDLK